MKNNKAAKRIKKSGKSAGPDHSAYDVGLPEDIRVVHSGEPNREDGQ